MARPESKLQRHLNHYKNAVAEGSADAYSHLGMGLMWHWHERYREALECYDQAAASEPFVPYVLCARANLRATCPLAEVRDGHQALLDAQRAFEGASLAGELQEEWRLRVYTAVLAAALSECGNFARAAEELSRAIGQLHTRTSKSELEQYLRLVEKGEPIRLECGLLRQGERRPGAA